MSTTFFLKGIILGFSIAAPVGPIGILCIRKTLQFGRLPGLFSGLGAAMADSIYAIFAAFGLTFISDLLLEWQLWFKTIGGIFLIYLGIKTIFAPIRHENNKARHSSLLNDFISTFFLTVTNPMTIISFLAIFAGLGFVNNNNSYLDATLLVLGVFLGSAAWWLMLSEGVTLFRKKVSEKVMRWINRIAGLLIASFGIAALFSVFFP